MPALLQLSSWLPCGGLSWPVTEWYLEPWFQAPIGISEPLHAWP